ncbi:hypothetical protein T439DRAFT_349448 [Meredithblackwellia eburnea MCA 4105]
MSSRYHHRDLRALNAFRRASSPFQAAPTLSDEESEMFYVLGHDKNNKTNRVSKPRTASDNRNIDPEALRKGLRHLPASDASSGTIGEHNSQTTRTIPGASRYTGTYLGSGSTTIGETEATGNIGKETHLHSTYEDRTNHAWIANSMTQPNDAVIIELAEEFWGMITYEINAAKKHLDNFVLKLKVNTAAKAFYLREKILREVGHRKVEPSDFKTDDENDLQLQHFDRLTPLFVAYLRSGLYNFLQAWMEKVTEAFSSKFSGLAVQYSVANSLGYFEEPESGCLSNTKKSLATIRAYSLEPTLLEQEKERAQAVLKNGLQSAYPSEHHMNVELERFVLAISKMQYTPQAAQFVHSCFQTICDLLEYDNPPSHKLTLDGEVKVTVERLALAKSFRLAVSQFLRNGSQPNFICFVDTVCNFLVQNPTWFHFGDFAHLRALLFECLRRYHTSEVEQEEDSGKEDNGHIRSK